MEEETMVVEVVVAEEVVAGEEVDPATTKLIGMIKADHNTIANGTLEIQTHATTMIEISSEISVKLQGQHAVEHALHNLTI